MDDVSCKLHKARTIIQCSLVQSMKTIKDLKTSGVITVEEEEAMRRKALEDFQQESCKLTQQEVGSLFQQPPHEQGGGKRKRKCVSKAKSSQEESSGADTASELPDDMQDTREDDFAAAISRADQDEDTGLPNSCTVSKDDEPMPSSSYVKTPLGKRGARLPQEIPETNAPKKRAHETAPGDYTTCPNAMFYKLTGPSACDDEFTVSLFLTADFPVSEF
jgi:hypothetical protein